MLIPIPYAADRELRRFPIVTLFLVGLNCSIFLLSLLGGTLTLNYITSNYGLPVSRPIEVSALFTSLVLHASVIHLLGNITYLWLFGCLVEDALGRAEYVFFYIGSGIAGGLLRVAVAGQFLPPEMHRPAVGASAAVAGILGLFAIRFYRARIKTLLVVPINIPSLYVIGGWVGVQFYNATASLAWHTGTEAWAHLGGFGFGVVTGLLMRMSHEAEEEYLFEDAERSLAIGQIKPALRSLHVLEGRHPDDPRVHRLLAKAYHRRDRLEVADMHARQAVELALEQKDIGVAVDNYLDLRAILSVLSLDAEFRIACALESQHRDHEAAATYKRVFLHYPETSLAGTALMRCVELLRRRHDGAAEASALSRQYLDRYPDGEWRAQAARYAKEDV